jgi:hypothetical protein
MMYRVLLIVGGAFALAACSSSPDWLNFDAMKPTPILDTVRFESEPPGAEAKTSNGQTCRTPCALALPVNAPLTVTFTLNGYLPESERIEPISASASADAEFTASGGSQLRPNPVMVELSPAPPSPQKPVKKQPAPKKKSSDKPTAARTKPSSAAQPAPAAPGQLQTPAPWPSTPPPQR